MYFRSTHVVFSLYKRLSKYVLKSKLVSLQIGLWKRLQKSVDMHTNTSIYYTKKSQPEPHPGVFKYPQVITDPVAIRSI